MILEAHTALIIWMITMPGNNLTEHPINKKNLLNLQSVAKSCLFTAHYVPCFNKNNKKMNEKELQTYLKERFPCENEACDWKEMKSLKNCFNGKEGDDVISYVAAI